MELYHKCKSLVGGVVVVVVLTASDVHSSFMINILKVKYFIVDSL